MNIRDSDYLTFGLKIENLKLEVIVTSTSVCEINYLGNKAFCSKICRCYLDIITWKLNIF